MKLFSFRVTHPQAEESAILASVPARNVEEARYYLDREFFFAQDLVNGYMFDVEFVRSADIPRSVKSDVIVTQLPDGRVMEKAFVPKR
jgi:hypothetical protein